MSETAINVNTATAEELDSVPGLCGHGIEIVRYRGVLRRASHAAFRPLRYVPRTPACPKAGS